MLTGLDLICKACIFELSKLQLTPDIMNDRELWLTLYNAETEEDLEKIESMGVPIMEQAVGAFRVTANLICPKFAQ